MSGALRICHDAGVEMNPRVRILWASWRFALLLAVAGVLAAAGAAWFVQHVRELRTDRVATGTPVACTVVDTREVHVARTSYPEIRVRLAADGTVRTAWLRALRPGRRWQPGDVVLVYVDAEGGLATADGYLSERVQVVSTDTAIAAAGLLLLLAAMGTAYAGSAACRHEPGRSRSSAITSTDQPFRWSSWYPNMRQG